MYYIRTAKGIMTAKIGNRLAGKIFSTAEGHWRPYREAGGIKTQCFEITEDSVFGIENELSLFLWKGFKIIEK